MSKRSRLLEELSDQTEPQVVPIREFFDGNDDAASIGCNLIDHPGIDAFRRVLVGLTERPDVEGVYAQIAELDPGEECWPFADTVLIAGTISVDELRRLLSVLKPDEVGTAAELGHSDILGEKHTVPITAAWWD